MRCGYGGSTYFGNSNATWNTPAVGGPTPDGYSFTVCLWGSGGNDTGTKRAMVKWNLTSDSAFSLQLSSRTVRLGTGNGSTRDFVAGATGFTRYAPEHDNTGTADEKGIPIFMAGVQTPTARHVFLNGVWDGTDAFPRDISAIGSPASLQFGQSGEGFQWEGSIMHACMWHCALTHQEIWDLYRGVHPTMVGGGNRFPWLAFYFPLMQQSNISGTHSKNEFGISSYGLEAQAGDNNSVVVRLAPDHGPIELPAGYSGELSYNPNDTNAYFPVPVPSLIPTYSPFALPVVVSG